MRRFLAPHLFLFAAATSAFTLTQNVDFGSCYNDKVANWSTSNFSNNATQYFPWNDKTNRFDPDPERPLLTLRGCEQLCGDGYQLWPKEETLLKFVLWVVPACILIAHFHFAPLPAANVTAIVAHLIGDPIDTMWSMLTRQEMNRRFYRRAITSGLNEGEYVATIWSTYDELGCTDPSPYFFKSLKWAGGRPSTQKMLGPMTSQQSYGSRPLPSNSSMTESVAPILRKPLPQEENALNFDGQPLFTHAQLGSITDTRDDVERYHIELACHRICSVRAETELTVWVAIIGLIGALIGAFIRTWIQRLNSQTAHTIAVVSLLFVNIPLVKVSSNIGAFSSTTAAVDIIEELRRNLQGHRRSQPDKAGAPPLFPPLDFQKKASQRFRALNSGGERSSTIIQWPRMASWAGMNSSFRPVKQIPNSGMDSGSNRGPFQLATISFLFVALGSYLPALFLSYMTYVVGFGCRSMAWTLIFCAWTVSPAFDYIIKSAFKSAYRVWTVTIIKDAIITVFVILTIFTVQLGFLNSCYCRSVVLGLREKAFVDLGPFTNAEWAQVWVIWIATPVTGLLITAILLFIAEHDSTNARSLLCKSQDKRQLALEHLCRRREELWPGSTEDWVEGADGIVIEGRPGRAGSDTNLEFVANEDYFGANDGLLRGRAAKDDSGIELADIYPSERGQHRS